MGTIANLLIKIGVDSDEAERKLKGLGSKAKSGLQKAMLPSVAVLGAVGVAAKGAADEASNLGEAQNAVSVVFGDSSKIINDFAKGAARSAGLSMLQANQAVVPLGASLKNYGFSAADAATHSVELAKRAADMASVFNTSVPEALDAIKSGLRGEADPLEKFGVGLNDAAVRAKAVALGLADTTAEVSDHAKMQARMALVMEQTNDLQGDFVRTSGSAANAARINAAEADNLRASFGQGLLPVLNTYQAVLAGVLGFMGQHQTATKVAIGVVAGLAAAVLTINGVMKAWSSLTTAATAVSKIFVTQTVAQTGATTGATAAQTGLNTAMRANVIGIVVTALAALAAGLVIAWQNSETFRRIVTTAFNAVKGAAQAAWEWVKEHWPLLLGILTGPIGLAVTAIVKNWDKVTGAVDAVKGAIGAIVGAVQAVVNSPVLQGIDNAFGSVFGAAKSVVNSVADAIQNVIGKVQSAVSLVSNLAGKVGGVVGAVGGIAGHFFADGGIVTRPTNAIIGEAGPEVVVPLTQPRRAMELMRKTGLDRMGSGGGGGPTVHVGTMVVQDATDIDRVASRLGRHLVMAG